MTAPDLTPVPLSPERLAEIRSTLLGDWLAGGWRVRNVTSTDDSRDRSEVFLPDATAEETVIATFPDWADPVAVFLADAHEAVPELLAEVDRLREFERRVTEEVEEFEDAAKDDPNTPNVARLMIANLRHAMGGAS
jgi:hypothetical protein